MDSGYTLRFTLLGHGHGEAFFPQQSDMRRFLSAIETDLVRYSHAPGDYRGKIDKGEFRHFNGPEAAHYE